MSLIEQLLSGPDAQDRYAQLQSMMDRNQGNSFDPVSAGSLPQGVLDPNDPSLVTRLGVTLARPAMNSLLDIARQSGAAPGIKELRWITDSYRSPQQQANAYAHKPGLAAPPGSSYHQRGLAIDAGRWSEIQQLVQLLTQGGWNRFSPTGEPWHWSYGVTG